MNSPSEELQKALYSRLTTDAVLMGMVEGVFDQAAEQQAHPFVEFGPSDATEDDADCIIGAEYASQINVWSRYNGQLEAKRIADRVKKVLHRIELPLTDHAMVAIWVQQIRILQDPDGETTHGVVDVRALVEETQ